MKISLDRYSIASHTYPCYHYLTSLLHEYKQLMQRFLSSPIPCYRQAILLGRSGISCCLIYPINPFSLIIGFQFNRISKNSRHISRILPIDIFIRFTLISCPFVSYHSMVKIRSTAKSIIGIKINRSLSCNSTFSRNNNYTIRSGRTVDCR